MLPKAFIGFQSFNDSIGFHSSIALKPGILPYFHSPKARKASIVQCPAGMSAGRKGGSTQLAHQYGKSNRCGAPPPADNRLQGFIFKKKAKRCLGSTPSVQLSVERPPILRLISSRA